MAGDFFAEDYNVILFVGVLGSLTTMMLGCYIYYKWQHIKSKNAPTLQVSQKRKRRLKQFFERASGSSQVERRAEDRRMRNKTEENFDFDTPASTPDDFLSLHNRQQSDFVEGVFEQHFESNFASATTNSQLSGQQYCSIHL